MPSSHDDHDHVGNLEVVLDRYPNARSCPTSRSWRRSGPLFPPAEARRYRAWPAALVAQGIERRFPKPCVAGSNPAEGAEKVRPGARRPSSEPSGAGSFALCRAWRAPSDVKGFAHPDRCLAVAEGLVQVPCRLVLGDHGQADFDAAASHCLVFGELHRCPSEPPSAPRFVDLDIPNPPVFLVVRSERPDPQMAGLDPIGEHVEQQMTIGGPTPRKRCRSLRCGQYASRRPRQRRRRGARQHRRHDCDRATRRLPPHPSV